MNQSVLTVEAAWCTVRKTGMRNSVAYMTVNVTNAVTSGNNEEATAPRAISTLDE